MGPTTTRAGSFASRRVVKICKGLLGECALDSLSYQLVNTNEV